MQLTLTKPRDESIDTDGNPVKVTLLHNTSHSFVIAQSE